MPLFLSILGCQGSNSGPYIYRAYALLLNYSLHPLSHFTAVAETSVQHHRIKEIQFGLLTFLSGLSFKISSSNRISQRSATVFRMSRFTAYGRKELLQADEFMSHPKHCAMRVPAQHPWPWACCHGDKLCTSLRLSDLWSRCKSGRWPWIYGLNSKADGQSLF